MNYYVFLLLMDDPFQLNHSELISFVNALNVTRICSVFQTIFFLLSVKLYSNLPIDKIASNVNKAWLVR